MSYQYSNYIASKLLEQIHFGAIRLH